MTASTSMVRVLGIKFARDAGDICLHSFFIRERWETKRNGVARTHQCGVGFRQQERVHANFVDLANREQRLAFANFVGFANQFSLIDRP